MSPKSKKGSGTGKVTAHQQVPVGQWVDVPKGYTVAMDTYVDEHGVLRCSSNDAIALWHMGGAGCGFVAEDASQIVYSDEGAPWCPQCWPLHLERLERNRLNKVFDQSRKAL